MDKIEKIRQEIERRLNILTNVYDELMERKDEETMTYYHGKVIALEELCPFLDTLSEEPDKSLEEAAEEYGKTQYGRKASLLPDRCRGCYAPIVYAFKAGAEWQKEQMMKEAVDGSLGYGPHLQRPIIMLEQVPSIWNGGCQDVKVIIVKEEGE